MHQTARLKNSSFTKLHAECGIILFIPIMFEFSLVWSKQIYLKWKTKPKELFEKLLKHSSMSFWKIFQVKIQTSSDDVEADTHIYVEHCSLKSKSIM